MADAQSVTLDASPRPGQIVSHEGEHYTTIKEGLAHILVPDGTPTSTDPKLSKEDTQRQQVFYNPIQQFNRDLSVLAIKAFGEHTVLRKQAKHELAAGKAARRLKKKKANRGATDAQHESSTLTEENDASKKRKLDDDGPAQADSNPTPPKKAKSAEDMPEERQEQENSETTSFTAPEQNDKKKAGWKPSFTILDALSATGLRALRYAQEIPFATMVTANDMSEKATASIALNVKHNKCEDKITAHTGNAIAYMYSFVDKKGFDVIDLDPYGTAAPFIDSAIQAIEDEGLLCVTCTDSAIFASHGYLEKTYSQYGGLPLKGDPCHEGGLRLILHAIASSAARYGMAIEPLLSLSIDYYVRVFVRVRKAPNDVKLLAGKTMIVYHCDNGCGAWTTQFLARNKFQKNKNGDLFSKHSFASAPTANEHCEHCGFKTHLSGPMYGGPLHNVEFIKRVLAQLKEVDRETYPTMNRIEGMLRTAMEEITFGTESVKDGQEPEKLDPLIPKADPTEIDHQPFFLNPGALSKVIHCSAPAVASLRGALRHAGFRATMSHCKPGSIKTDASWKAIWHIMQEWVRQKAPLKNALKEGTAGREILSKTIVVQQPGAAAENSTNEQNLAIAEGDIANKEERRSYLGVDFEVKFDEKLGKDQDRGKLVRYQVAPRENWGPMARAK
ncbi:N2,N2-dimethylguanosine tRNA methyltransferase [Periconia macrospinosa]|uniref:tRNA (guanine(26)-N(2))-dimethyltransferase n=1 Tax=Periconia macrospinosa TaxID=97972 RepID=A0A2V1E9P7_9PLEO|nr:N2,N2-dimethylguanosine tRNA methyltransferase [Periconia macrospinosa]